MELNILKCCFVIGNVHFDDSDMLVLTSLGNLITKSKTDK